MLHCRTAAGAVALATCAIATPSLADPCTAIPDRGQPSPEVAHLIRKGATFTGQVRYVGDGDNLCIGETPHPRTWIEVRIEDFYAAELNAPGGREAKQALERIAMGKRATCTASHRSWDRVVATCRIGGTSLADLMRRAGVMEGGNASRNERAR